ncbi:glycoside hydrolase family 3 N-terminal domain-containing protein [uncultured Shewanella sp.]|uniref:glycoside hydrolase family 3 protein n=1 Tax=uncultured Shewanella sp. TaxID=173975 RepID=UPI002627A935|nr:glycoside hydrolase family 3 N-terminal domain-containing protein [uncultured Shewanella sp.]
MPYTRLFLILTFFIFITSCNNDDNTQEQGYSYYRTLTAPIVESMTLKQKLGQMTLPSYSFLINNGTLDYSLIQEYALGAIIVAGSETPDGEGSVSSGKNEASAYLTATKDNWNAITTGTNTYGANIRLADGQQLTIPLLIGLDAVHGVHEILGNVIFPHNIGLSMTYDNALLTHIGKVVANDMLLNGFNWTFSPTVAISHNPNWGRTYETLGSVPDHVRINSEALVNGFQQIHQGMIPETGVLATVKHFIGDGATQDGIDQGNNLVLDEERFIDVNAQGYIGAINADVGSLMVSYSAVNSIPMTIEEELKARLLQGNLIGAPFTGFVVSDYGAVNNIAERGLPTSSLVLPFDETLADAVNSGIDMIMITYWSDDFTGIDGFLSVFEDAVNEGLISEERINEAVNSILAVKYAMGLISVNDDGKWSHKVKTLTEDNYTQDEKIAMALSAAEKSLVLLKNDNNLLPIDSGDIEYIVFAGDDDFDENTDSGTSILNIYQNYHNIGAQSGGWSMAWQGTEGNTLWEDESDKASSGAVTIYEGLRAAFPDATLLMPTYNLSGSTDNVRQTEIDDAQSAFLTQLDTNANNMNADNTLIIWALAERPSAEYMGGVSNPYCEEGLDNTQGCLYASLLNPYVPDTQATSLDMSFLDLSFDTQVIEQVQGYDDGIPLLTVLISGRPRIIDDTDTAPLPMSDAFIAAWLPGPTGGTAIANAITGDYLFCGGVSEDGTYCNDNSANTLSINWVATDDSLDNYPIYTQGSGLVTFDDPLYEIGYGLPTFTLSE